MFRQMRRFKQQLPNAETVEILETATSGVLAVSGDDGYPYAVPLSFVYADGKLFFHCAVTGHKLDAIQNCDKASFCVIASDVVRPATFTTHYRSVVAFGRVRVLTDDAQKRAAIELIADKYSRDYSEKRLAEIENEFPRLALVEFKIEHVTGKEARELMEKR